MIRLLLATRSVHKTREIRALLPAGTELLTLDDAGIAYEEAEEEIEAFLTFRENALAKARHFSARAGLPTLADDSGIAVHALGGRPGVHSKRYAAEPGLAGLALDEANNARLLQELRQTPPELRTAHYACAAALVLAEDRVAVALGTCTGVIVQEPRGSGGFGYDPLFAPAGVELTFAELPPEAKNRLSHRGRAFRALALALPLLRD